MERLIDPPGPSRRRVGWFVFVTVFVKFHFWGLLALWDGNAIFSKSSAPNKKKAAGTGKEVVGPSAGLADDTLGHSIAALF